MSDSENLPLSAFMPHHPSSDPHAPFTAKAGKKNNICARKIELSEVIKCIETIYDPETVSYTHLTLPTICSV